jgi:hypothetical protein
MILQLGRVPGRALRKSAGAERSKLSLTEFRYMPSRRPESGLFAYKSRGCRAFYEAFEIFTFIRGEGPGHPAGPQGFEFPARRRWHK